VSGLCQPIYVLDIPGGFGKVPLMPGAARPDPASGGWIVTDPAGRRHSYPADPDSARD
jgi:lysine 2,3-aminomutase